MSNNANRCNCEQCPAAGCPCGCREVKQEGRPGCGCGAQCPCGPDCDCAAP